MAGNRKRRAQVGKAVLHDSTWTDVLGRKDISDPWSIGRVINRGTRVPVILHLPATELKSPQPLWSLDNADPVGRARLLEERIIPIMGRGCVSQWRDDYQAPQQDRARSKPTPGLIPRLVTSVRKPDFRKSGEMVTRFHGRRVRS